MTLSGPGASRCRGDGQLGTKRIQAAIAEHPIYGLAAWRRWWTPRLEDHGAAQPSTTASAPPSVPNPWKTIADFVAMLAKRFTRDPQPGPTSNPSPSG